MLVELGGGTNPHPRADLIIDLHHPRHSPEQDAAITPWRCHDGPWAEADQGYLHSELVDEVYCSHFMEHIHRGQPLLNVMNEAWRILKPGGTFTMILPLVGYTDPVTGSPKSDQIGWQPWADPTHVNYWWFPEALLYFCEGPFKPHANYGINIWSALGSWVPEAEASSLLNSQRSAQAPTGNTFWSVRSEWEGIARLAKP